MEAGKFVNNGNIPDQLCKKRYSDAGLDLRCDLHKEIKLFSKVGLTIINDDELEEVILPAFSRIILNTSINVAVPNGCVGLIWDRSGLAANQGITILAGAVDENYVGPVLVVMFNSSYEDYIIHNHDRIAQLLTVPINLEYYNEVSSLEDTDRGSTGFGASGYN